MNESTLQHWGIKGMKWGVRRYQNKDGSLTDLGRKHEKEMAAKLKTTKKEVEELKKENETLKKTINASRPKNANEMSDQELRERVTRLNLEQQYKQYVSSLYPETKSRGRKFVDKLTNDVLIPAAVEVGKSTAKTIMTNAVNSALNSMAKTGASDNKEKKN